jgi:hypothetical protein
MPVAKQGKSWSSENISSGEIASVGLNGAAAALTADGTRVVGRYNEARLKDNAKLFDQAAEDVLKKAEFQVDDIKRKTKQLVGAQRAAFAANGIEINDGSAADVQEDTFYWSEVDQQTARNNAFLESYGYKIQALNLRTQAEVSRATTDYQYRINLLEAGINAGEQVAKAGAS